MDRKFVLALILMVGILVVPSFFLKQRTPPARPKTAQPVAPAPTIGGTPGTAETAGTPPAAAPADSAAAAPAVPVDTVVLRNGIASYAVSTEGGRIVSATITNYPSLARGDDRRPAELVAPGASLLELLVVDGRDTIPVRTARLAADSAGDRRAPAALRLTGTAGGRPVELTYTLAPDDYRLEVAGTVGGISPNGGLLLVGLGRGIRNTEADTVQNQQAAAVVVKRDNAEQHAFAGMDVGKPETFSGPFDWAAVKSKYFVTALLAADSAQRVSGVRAVPLAAEKGDPHAGDVVASLPLPASGAFRTTLYAGPMEYDRLARLGRDFDDVNPYGWSWVRPIIRPVSAATRWLLVWMHDSLGLAYGLGLIAFGILVRIVLWPLNQKAMRSSMQMQAIQPLMKRIQEQYANDPQRQQQEMFKLYKEHGVNPLGGCWPMLLPMPILFALFFVFQNTIELRGASFLWIPDLSLADPLYIIPILMGVTMFAVSWVGQMGMEANPQAKMMLYVMPVMMTFLFLNFASGLNLYYAVSNLASIPQQWLLSRERMKRTARAIVEVKTKEPEVAVKGRKKRT